MFNRLFVCLWSGPGAGWVQCPGLGPPLHRLHPGAPNLTHRGSHPGHHAARTQEGVTPELQVPTSIWRFFPREFKENQIWKFSSLNIFGFEGQNKESELRFFRTNAHWVGSYFLPNPFM